VGKTNYAVAVHDAVYWTVNRVVYRAVDGAVEATVSGAVYRTVDNAVSGAVSGAGYGAVYWSVWGDPDHPALQDFLRKTSTEAEAEA